MATKNGSLPFAVGDKIFIRTVTHFHIGRVDAITPDFVQLGDASWVADTERFSITLAEGKLRESERCPSWVLIGRGSIVDIFPWAHDLPAESVG